MNHEMTIKHKQKHSLGVRGATLGALETTDLASQPRRWASDAGDGRREELGSRTAGRREEHGEGRREGRGEPGGRTVGTRGGTRGGHGEPGARTGSTRGGTRGGHGGA
jgi:hypothetical protein